MGLNIVQMAKGTWSDLLWKATIKYNMTFLPMFPADGRADGS